MGQHERKGNQGQWILKKLSIYVAICFLLIIIYTMVDLYIFYNTGNEPGTLTQMFFTVFGVELLACMVKAIINKKGGGGNGGCT